MKVLRKIIAQGVRTLPLTEISSRDLRKEGEHKKMMNDALVVEIREYQDSREEDLHGLPCSFSFRAWVTEHVAESSHVAFIT
jgi:hypothetical protein